MARRSGSSRSGPIGHRVSAVIPLNTVSRDKLRPDVGHDVVAQRDAEARVAASLEQAIEQRRSSAVERAKDEAAHGGMANQARLGDHRRDIRRASGHMRATHGACQRLDAVHAVLKRDDERVGSDERRQHSCRLVRVVQFDREEDDIDGADRGGVVGRLHACHLVVALRTVDPKTALAKSRKMRAAGDERHVRARLRQTSAKIAADAAAAKDRNTHNLGNDTCVHGGRPDPVRRRALHERPRMIDKRGEAGMNVRYTIVDSPLGRLLVAATSRGVCAVAMGRSDVVLRRALALEHPGAAIAKDHGALSGWTREILAHLSGRRPRLQLPLDVQATAFQWQVWNALAAIPRGETRSYAAVAAAVGRPRAARAVGRACATNPVALAIPCHRVVPAAGGVGGYRWGASRKERCSPLRVECRSDDRSTGNPCGSTFFPGLAFPPIPAIAVISTPTS